ncbi:MAG: DUF2254 domain-containing protein [Mycobacteriales bacterium]
MAAGPIAQRWAVVNDAFRSQIWPLPVLGVVVATVLGIVLPSVDARVDDQLASTLTRYLFTGGPDAARAVLGAVSGSLVTLTSLTFSLTVVTLQLASSQFSPRLLRTFSSDRFVHVTLMLFVSTFVYSLTVLRTVRTATADAPGFVPQISVTVGLLLALASVVGLVAFLAHLAGEIRVETLLRRVHTEARATILRVTDAREDGAEEHELPVPPSGSVPILATSSGFLTSVDVQGLVGRVRATGGVFLLERPPGSSVVDGTPVGWIWHPAPGGLQVEALQELTKNLDQVLRTTHEPTSAQDLTFGMKQITDVATKALSPGINDPRTAVHALAHSAALLCLLAGRSLGPLRCVDEDGAVRLHRALPDFAALLDLAVSAPRRYGAADPDLLARIYALLAEVAWVTALPRHHQAVRDQLERLERTVDSQDFDGTERARLADLGVGVRAALAGEHRSPATTFVA